MISISLSLSLSLSPARLFTRRFGSLGFERVQVQAAAAAAGTSVPAGFAGRHHRTGQRMTDPDIRLFGRVIPLTAEAEELLTPPAPEDAAAAAAAHEAQHSEKEENENSELKVNTPQHREKDDMNDDVSEEEKETEMKVDMRHEKEVEEMEGNASQQMENVGLDESATLDHKKDDKEQINNAEDKAAPEPNEDNGKTANDESGQEKTVKKPDKILPCPRCNSMDTKFCYYNNYNVNQPRHFCKN